MKYPVLAYETSDFRIYAFPKEDILRHTSREILEGIGFDGLKLIDSDGNHYSIISAREVGWAPKSFFGYSLLKGRQIIVDFNFENLGNLSLDELKKFVLERVKASKGLYQSYGGGSKYIIESVENANSYGELIEIFY